MKIFFVVPLYFTEWQMPYEHEGEIVNKLFYFRRALEIAKKIKTDLVVFPEGFFFEIWGKTIAAALEQTYAHTKSTIPILTGVRKSDGSQWYHYHNPQSIEGDTAEKWYCKHSMADKIAFEFKNELPADLFEPIILQGKRIQCNICHDMFFPLITEKMTQQPIDLLINLTGQNVVASKWYNVFAGRSIETQTPVFCTMSWEEMKKGEKGKNGKGEAFGFFQGSKITPMIAKTEDWELFDYAIFDTNNIKTAPLPTNPSLPQNKYKDLFLGFGSSDSKTQINLNVSASALIASNTKAERNGWHSSKKPNAKLLILPYSDLLNRRKLHDDKIGFSKDENAAHIVVYHSTKPVDAHEAQALLKLRAIETRIIAVCHAPNYKAIAKTNSYKNIQFYGDIKDGDCVGLDLRYAGGLYGTVFSKDEKGKRNGIPKQFAKNYLALLD